MFDYLLLKKTSWLFGKKEIIHDIVTIERNSGFATKGQFISKCPFSVFQMTIKSSNQWYKVPYFGPFEDTKMIFSDNKETSYKIQFLKDIKYLAL